MMEASEAFAAKRLLSRANMTAAAALLLLLLFGLAASLLMGDIHIDAATVWNALIHHDAHLSKHVIVRDWRLPRAVADVMVGAALAVAGAIMQAVTRNPLASPGIMGINTGASFAAVLALVVAPAMPFQQLMLMSIAGAAVGATLVYGLGSLSPGGLTPVRLALTGIAVSAVLGAIGNGITIYYDLGQDLLYWFARGTEGVRWSDIGIFFPLGCVGLIGAAAIAPGVGVLTLGDHVSRGLGQRTRLTKFVAAAIVLILAGGAVSLAGPIGFVGLMAPHMVRYIVGSDYRVLIPASALFGALFLLLADLVARLAATPFKTPVPVGVVTALIGVPFFLYLACRRSTNARGDAQ
jgi:iron complex transport system permease protein